MNNEEKLQAALSILASLNAENIFGEIEYDLVEVPAPRSAFGSGNYTSLQVTVNFVDDAKAKLLKLAALKKEKATTEKYLYELEALISRYGATEDVAKN